VGVLWSGAYGGEDKIEVFVVGRGGLRIVCGGFVFGEEAGFIAD